MNATPARRTSDDSVPTRIVRVVLTLRLTPSVQLSHTLPELWEWAVLLDLDEDDVLGVTVRDERLEYEGTND